MPGKVVVLLAALASVPVASANTFGTVVPSDFTQPQPIPTIFSVGPDVR